jgi:hypothetical protein
MSNPRYSGRLFQSSPQFLAIFRQTLQNFSIALPPIPFSSRNSAAFQDRPDLQSFFECLASLFEISVHYVQQIRQFAVPIGHGLNPIGDLCPHLPH